MESLFPIQDSVWMAAVGEVCWSFNSCWLAVAVAKARVVGGWVILQVMGGGTGEGGGGGFGPS